MNKISKALARGGLLLLAIFTSSQFASAAAPEAPGAEKTPAVAAPAEPRAMALSDAAAQAEVTAAMLRDIEADRSRDAASTISCPA